jgi:pyruvate/2-oxoglutarate dehydrogenase complex dihydrolipoamide dehydrogenase (E3) component
MYDLVVLGGGSGGLSVATAAARLGARVALVEKGALGGECTHTACVPTKSLYEAARLAHQIRTAGRYGIRAGTLEIDFPAVMQRIRGVVAGFAGSGTGDSLRAQGIHVYLGAPAFEAYDTIVVDGQTRLHAHRFVIATGSRAAIPPIPGLAGSGYLDNDSFWTLDELPAELVILGAGPSGTEFAQALARLGSKVTMLASTSHVLPAEDPEVSERVRTFLEGEGITIRTDVEVTSVAVRDGRKVCTVKDSVGGTSEEVSGTHLLVAAGRLANVEGLNLEAVGIHADPEHGIEVDDYLQTHSSRIYAIGDVLQKHMFTHAAEREAAVVFQNAVIRISKKIDYSALPWATFIDPEVATVGLSEAAAREQQREIHVLRAELSESDRARIDGRTEGFVKVVATPGGKVLGATIVGPEAALVLQEFVLAIEHSVTLQEIADTVHIYPTYSGLAQRIAHEFHAARHQNSFVRKAVRWIHGYGDPSRTASEENVSPLTAAGDAHAPSPGHANGHGHS